MQTQDIDTVNSRSTFAECHAAVHGLKPNHHISTIPWDTWIKLYTQVGGVANMHDQVIESYSDIESLKMTDIDPTNRSWLAFAWILLITLEISRDLHRMWWSMMMISKECKDSSQTYNSVSSHTYKEESPDGPPPHPRKPHQAPPESLRPQ